MDSDGVERSADSIMNATIHVATQRRLALANYSYLLLLMFVIAGILTAAMTLQ